MNVEELFAKYLCKGDSGAPGESRGRHGEGDGNRHYSANRVKRQKRTTTALPCEIPSEMKCETMNVLYILWNF